MFTLTFSFTKTHTNNIRYWEVTPRIYASMHSEIPYFLVSMSVVGGIMFTGLSGAVVGPLILSGFLCTMRLVQMHHASNHR